MRLSVLGPVSLAITFVLTALVASVGCGDDDAAPASSSSGASSSGAPGTSGDVGTSSGGSSGTSGGTPFNPTTKNAAAYSFPADDTAWSSAAGTYKLDCTQAEAAPFVPGVGYVELKADKSMTLFAADGSAVVKLDGLSAENSALVHHIGAATPNPEYWTYTITTKGSAPTYLRMIFFGDGKLDFVGAEPGKNSGRCVSNPGRTLHYGIPVPADFATIAGTTKMAAPSGTPKYDLVIDAAGNVTVNQTDPAGAANPAYATKWTGGVQPSSKGTGDYVIYPVGKTDGNTFDLQIQSSAGSDPQGFSLSVVDKKITYAAHGFIVLNPAK